MEGVENTGVEDTGVENKNPRDDNLLQDSVDKTYASAVDRANTYSLPNPGNLAGLDSGKWADFGPSNNNFSRMGWSYFLDVVVGIAVLGVLVLVMLVFQNRGVQVVVGSVVILTGFLLYLYLYEMMRECRFTNK
jgi:hypothetical protein